MHFRNKMFLLVYSLLHNKHMWTYVYSVDICRYDINKYDLNSSYLTTGRVDGVS